MKLREVPEYLEEKKDYLNLVDSALSVVADLGGLACASSVRSAAGKTRRPVRATKGFRDLGIAPRKEKNGEKKDGADWTHTAIVCSFRVILLTSYAARMARFVQPHPFFDLTVGKMTKTLPYFAIFFLSSDAMTRMEKMHQGTADHLDVSALVGHTMEISGLVLGEFGVCPILGMGLSLVANAMTFERAIIQIRSSSSKKPEDRKSGSESQ